MDDTKDNTKLYVEISNKPGEPYFKFYYDFRKVHHIQRPKEYYTSKQNIIFYDESYKSMITRKNYKIK